MVHLTNGQHTCKLVFQPKANILNILRDCQFVFSVLDDFMSHIMLDATGVVLRVHYKSMKCDVLISQGSTHTVFRWGGHLSYMSTKISSSSQQCKNYKNRWRFSKVMITNVMPPFYGSQCRTPYVNKCMKYSCYVLTEQFLCSLWWTFCDGLYCHTLYIQSK